MVRNANNLDAVRRAQSFGPKQAWNKAVRRGGAIGALVGSVMGLPGVVGGSILGATIGDRRWMRETSAYSAQLPIEERAFAGYSGEQYDLAGFDRRHVTISVAGREMDMHYLHHQPTQASKGTIVFLHGFLADRFQTSNLQYDVAQHGYEVYSFDLPGHGSSTPLHYINTNNLVSAVSASLEKLDITDACIAGPSLGGYLSLNVAAMSDRIARTVLIAPMMIYGHAINLSPAFKLLAADPQLPLFGRLLGSRGMERLLAKFVLGEIAGDGDYRPVYTAGEIYEFADRVTLQSGSASSQRFYARSAYAEWLLELVKEEGPFPGSALNKPALVLYGTRDETLPPSLWTSADSEAYFTRNIPGLVLGGFAGVGHDVEQQAPSGVRRAMQSFLNGDADFQNQDAKPRYKSWDADSARFLDGKAV